MVFVFPLCGRARGVESEGVARQESRRQWSESGVRLLQRRGIRSDRLENGEGGGEGGGDVATASPGQRLV
jgi:hypothetical protein